MIMYNWIINSLLCKKPHRVGEDLTNVLYSVGWTTLRGTNETKVNLQACRWDAELLL